jgi:hypothetical protein
LIKFNQTAGRAVGASVTLLAFTQLAATPAPRVVRFLGERAAQTLTDAARVEIYRVKDKRANEGQKAVGGYVIEAAGREQGEAFARRVAALLLDEKSYRFDAPAARSFKPTVGLRVWAKERWVEVLWSPTAGEVVVFSPNPEDGSVRSAQADVAPAREALTALTSEAPPEG